MAFYFQQTKLKNLEEAHWTCANNQGIGFCGLIQTKSLGYSLVGGEVNKPYFTN